MSHSPPVSPFLLAGPIAWVTGGTPLSLSADVARRASLRRAFERLQRRFGRVNVVFAPAGVNRLCAPLGKRGIDESDETLAINLHEVFLPIKFAVPLMRENGRAMVVTSSVNRTRRFGHTGATASAVSKAGPVAPAPERIRANTICPGAITRQIDDNTRQHGLTWVRIPVRLPAGRIPRTRGAPSPLPR